MISRTIVVSMIILSFGFLGFTSFVPEKEAPVNNLFVTVDSPNCSLATVTVLVDDVFLYLSPDPNTPCVFAGSVEAPIKVEVFVCISSTNERGHEIVTVKSDGATNITVPVGPGQCEQQ